MFSLWFDQLQKISHMMRFDASLALLDYRERTSDVATADKKAGLHFFDDIRTPQKKYQISYRNHLSMLTMYTKLRDRWCDTNGHSRTSFLQNRHIRRDIRIGGGHGIVNAAAAHTGPSWRMIVHFAGSRSRSVCAIYPGGESGNIASPFYTDMIDDWAKRICYRLHFLRKQNDIP